MTLGICGVINTWADRYCTLTSSSVSRHGTGKFMPGINAKSTFKLKTKALWFQVLFVTM